MKIESGKQFGDRECPACACKVAANENHCPICGYAFPHPTPLQHRMRLWGALLMLALFFILILGLL